MNAHRMDQGTVERLLVGSGADAQDGPEVLIRLLAAVRAAPHPHELSGEAAAVQAFRVARAGSVPVVAARTERRVFASLLSVKIALAALLAATSGGVALAAVTGALPDSLGGDEPTTVPSASGQPSPTAHPGVSPTPTASPIDLPGGPAALAGLCTAYQAEPKDKWRVLESSRFADLVSAAGGPEKVTGYCDRLLGERKAPSTSTANATRRPDVGEPTGRVTARPERTPAGHGGPERPADPAVNPASVGPTPH